MEHWEFLIQKQGDRSWQSLESSSLKIVTGKYRVLARSSLVNTDVEVRVTHSSILEMPPKRRVFKRSRRTDSNGLVAIIPFTDLQPGMWELRCCGDLMTDMLGESWEHSIFLNVSALATDQQQLLDNDDQLVTEYQSTVVELNESDSEFEDTNTLPTINPEDIIINEPVSPVLFKGNTAEEIVQNLIALALPSSEPWENDLVEEKTSVVESQSLPLQLCLTSDNYIAEWGKVLQVNGNVILDPENLQDQQLSNLKIYQLHLDTELRSPLESNILTTSRQHLKDQSLPFPFSTIIDIPSDCESKLILGNINLYGIITPGDEVTLLGSQPFTVTADITELLNVTSEKSHSTDLLPDDNPVLSADLVETVEPPKPLGLELFNVAKTSQLAQFRILKPSSNQPFPEKIKPVIFAEKLSPELPKLPRIHKSLITDNAESDDSSDSQTKIQEPTYIPPINLDNLVIKQTTVSFPFLKKLQPPEPEPKAEPKAELSLPTVSTKLPSIDEKPENYDSTLIEDPIPEIPIVDNQEYSHRELIEDTIPEIPIVDNHKHEQLVNDNPLQISDTTSPLIQKWIANHGYLLDEGIEIVDENNHADNSQDRNQEPSVTDNPDLHTIYGNTNHKEREEQEEIRVVDISDVSSNNDESSTEEQQNIHTDSDQKLLDLSLNLDVNPDVEIDTSPELPEPILLDTEQPLSLPKPPEKKLAWLSEEVVMDDVYFPEIEPDHNPSSEVQLPNLSAQKSELLPTPELFLPDGELVAGKSINVRLEVPLVSQKVMIKLWVEDYQNRDLLDGPHFLKDLRPNAMGNWEANTELIVPLGCVQILIGAIAVNASTQQESHKVTMLKTVIPANLPNIELDQMLDF